MVMHSKQWRHTSHSAKKKKVMAAEAQGWEVLLAFMRSSSAKGCLMAS